MEVGSRSWGRKHWRPFWRSVVTPNLANAAGRSTYGPDKVRLIVDEFADRLALRPDHALLDIGCSMGLVGEPLSRRCRYVGVDYVEHFVSDFERRAGVPLACADATRLPFPDAAFDRTLMAGVLQALTYDEAALALREMRRVTRRDGRGLLSSVVVVTKAEPDSAVASWLVEDLEAAVLEAGWRSFEWRGIHDDLVPSIYHRDLLVAS